MMRPSVTRSPGVARRLAALALVTLWGCAAASNGGVIHLRDLPQRPTFDVEWLRTDRAAAAVAMAAMEQELGLPRLDVALHVFPSRQTFQDALVTIGYEPAFAEQTASRMTAIGGFRTVLLNGEALARSNGPSRAALLAHEFTHSLQYELGGGTRGTSAQWLREGFADWVAAHVLATLGVQPFEEFRARRLQLLRGLRDRSPALGEMTTFPEWVELAGRTDAAAVSAKAFAAVDFLIARAGMQKVLDYFSLFAASADSERNFSRAFGEPREVFEEAFDAQVQSSRR